MIFGGKDYKTDRIFMPYHCFFPASCGCGTKLITNQMASDWSIVVRTGQLDIVWKFVRLTTNHLAYIEYGSRVLNSQPSNVYHQLSSTIHIIYI